jgi:hypothetical protein
MTADERLALIRVKVERASKHIAEINTEIGILTTSHPYEVAPKGDPHIGQPRFYLTKAAPIPLHFGAIVGDVVQNLRSALDHLVYQLFLVNGGTNATAAHLYFPTDSSATLYKASAPRKIQGLRQDAIDAINSIEPYDGGKGAELSVLNRLNRTDKHRLLITVTSVSYPDVPLKSLIEHIAPEIIANFPVPDDVILRAASPDIYGLKVGDEVPLDPRWKLKMGQKVQFRFGLAFNEPGVIKGKPMLPTLKQMADLVDHLILSFRPFLQ